MLARIIEWSIRNVFLVLVGTFFIIAAGVYAVMRTPLDAIPDLSDVQVIIYTEYPGQAPQVVEDQITYPLSTAMLAVPKSKVVRGLSVFGASFIYVIFEDGTDIYWARRRPRRSSCGVKNCSYWFSSISSGRDYRARLRQLGTR